MSRNQGQDQFRLAQTAILDVLRGSNAYRGSNTSETKTNAHVTSRNTQGQSNYFPQNDDRSGNLLGKGTQESKMHGANTSFNPVRNLDSLSRFGNVHKSSAFDVSQNYGSSGQSSLRNQDWNLDFLKNVDSKKASQILGTFSSDVKNSEEFYKRSPEPKYYGDTPLSDLNLKTVEEEDEFLYGDSNSMPEIPKSIKKNSVSEDVQNVWSDDDDLFQDSPKKISDPDTSRNNWNVRNKSASRAAPNSPQMKLQRVSVGEKMGSKTTESLKSNSIEHIKTKLFASNPAQEKNFVADDIRSTTGSVNKEKYHAAAQVLKKQSTDKSSYLMNENIDLPHHDINVEREKSSRSNVDKDFKSNKIPEKNMKFLPKAFSQKDQGSKNYAKETNHKRIYSQEGYEPEIKHPRYNNPRDSSPSRNSPYDSSRMRSPIDDHRYRPPGYPVHKLHPSNYKYRSYYSQHKSPHRDYERHSYEFSPRHDDQKHYSRSPPRRSRERSPRYYRYREKSPLRKSRERSKSPEYYKYKEKSPIKRSRERSKSPGYYKYKEKRSRERSRSPGYYIKRSRERSRSTEYYKSRENSLEHQYKKKSYKSYEMRHKSPESHSKHKKKKDYSSGDSFCSLSLESESNSSINSYNGTEKQSKSRSEKKDEEKNLSKAPNVKVESKSETKVAKDFNKLSSKEFVQSLGEIRNFKGKTSEETEAIEIFNNNEEFDIMKMFENSQLLSDLVESVQDSASSLSSSVPSIVNTSHNMTLPMQNPAVISMPFPQSYSLGPVPNIPIHYPPSQVSTFPLPFRPPLAMQATPPTSMLAPLSQTVLQSSLVEVPRIPEVKQMTKKRPQTLRPINLQEANETILSSPQKQIEIKASKDNVPINQKQSDMEISELSVKYSELIEKYKKLKAEKHLSDMKVNSSVKDLCDVRKIVDENFGKKKTKTPSEAAFHSKCKHIISTSQDNLSKEHKEGKRLLDELNRLKQNIPQKLLIELSSIKIEPSKEVYNEFYSGFDSGSHTCFICNQQFYNLSSILEHFHSEEHIEQMNIQDTEWTNIFDKHTELEAGKKLTLKPVQGIEFLRPLTGFYCTICSETILNNSSAESHLKSHDHFVNFNDYILKHPLYERKCLLKQFVMHSMQKKDKEMQAKQEQIINRRKLAAVEEKIKEKIKDQASKEKVVDELKDNDDNVIASSNQNSGGIKLTLSGENEKSKEESKDKDTKEKPTSKGAQKPVYIGKAPNFKTRPKLWYKREIYQKNESASEFSSSSPSLAKEPFLTENVSFSGKKSSKIGTKTSSLGKSDQSTKKKVEYTCLTEEASEKLDVAYEESGQEKLPGTKDPVVNQAIKNILLGTDSSMHKDIPLSEIKLPEIQPDNDSSANPTLQGESHKPLPMEIEDSPETYTPVLPSPQKLTAEEEKDFFILGINREDFRPLVVPVPPPSSLMNPNFYKNVPPPTVICNAKSVPPPTLVCSPKTVPPPTLVCNTSVPPPNFNINIAQPITVPPPPVSVSPHLTSALNSNLQSPEFKPIKSNRNLITIVPTKTLISPTKSVGKNVDASPVKHTEESKESSHSPNKNLDNKSSKVCLKSKSENTVYSSIPPKEILNEQNISQSSGISFQTTKSETSAKLKAPVNNLSQSETTKEIEVEKENTITGKVIESATKLKGQDNVNSEISLVSKIENKPDNVIEVQNEKQIISEVSNSVSTMIEKVIESDSTTSLAVQSESEQNYIVQNRNTTFENKNELIVKSNVSDSLVKIQETTSKENLITNNENSCSIIGELLNEEQDPSQFCEFVSKTPESNSSLSENTVATENNTPLIIEEKDLTEYESVKKVGVSVNFTSGDESTSKCEAIYKQSTPVVNLCNSASEMEVDDDNSNVFETVSKRSNSSNEKQVGSTFKGSSVSDDESSCCIIGEMVSKEKNLSESHEIDLAASKSDLLNFENVIKSDISPSRDLEDASQSEFIMETEDEGAVSGEVVKSLIENELNISSNKIQDDLNFKIISEDGNSSTNIIEIQIEEQVTCVKLKNISETSDSTKIEKNLKCEEEAPSYVPVDNLDQSETVMKAGAENVAITSEKDSQSIEINWKGSTTSLKNTISECKMTKDDKSCSNVEGQQAMQQNVSELCTAVSESSNSCTFLENSMKTETLSDISVPSNNLFQSESALENDVEDMIIISEDSNESIKDECFIDSCNESQNNIPNKMLVTDEVKSCNIVSKSTIEEENIFKACEIVSKSCDSTSSEIKNTLKCLNVDELSSPKPKLCYSASSGGIDDSSNVISENNEESICIIKEDNDSSSMLESSKDAENSSSNNFALPDKGSSVLDINLTASSVICKENKTKTNICLEDTLCESEKQFASDRLDSNEAQFCIDGNPHTVLKLPVDEYSTEEKSGMEIVSPSVSDSIQVRNENSTELNQTFVKKEVLDKDCLNENISDTKTVYESDVNSKSIKTDEEFSTGRSLLAASSNVSKSDMDICSSTILELLSLKDAQPEKNSMNKINLEELKLPSNQSLELESNATFAPTQNCEESNEIKIDLSSPMSAFPKGETSGSIQEDHQESSTEVISKDQDAENKVVENESEKTIPDNLDETEILSKSDTDTEEYEDEEQ